MSLRACKYCGSEIADKPGRGAPRLFCSLQCTQRYHHVKKRLLENRDAQIKMVCAGCGKEFAATTKRAKYCSLDCIKEHNPHYYAAALRRHRQKGTELRLKVGEKTYTDLELRVLKDIETENDPNYVKPKLTKVLAPDCDKDFKCRTEPFGDISREDMMALVAKRNESWSSEYNLLRMPLDEFRDAFGKLSKDKQKSFRNFYVREYELKPSTCSRMNSKGSGLLEQISTEKTLVERVSDAIYQGRLGYIRGSRKYKRVASGNEA